MSELNDYKGEFKPDLKMEDFSKDFMLKLMQQWAKAYIRMAEIFNTAVIKRYGTEAALEIEIEAWSNIGLQTVPRIAKAMGIEVKTIVDAMKVWQILPDGIATGMYDEEFEVLDDNHVIMKMARCMSLEYFEKIGAKDRIIAVCELVDPPVNQAYLEGLVPDAEIKPLKLPRDGVRQDADPSIAPCEWELKLKSE